MNLSKVAIVINLYYVETLNYYVEYIKNIPEGIHIYLISSSEEILEYLEGKFHHRRDTHYLLKNNRGRDISALLVSFGETALQYKYVCFLHDKKEKKVHQKVDTDFWVKNLWSNTIGSEEYIYRILAKFEREDKLGMIVPPLPSGEYGSLFGERFWTENHERTCKLANELGVQCEIDSQKAPLTIGTVFWARTESLKKLLTYNWRYEDFPEEPMKNDGQINHAIERVLGYVVLDAGFQVETSMIDFYALELYKQREEQMATLMMLLREELDVWNVHHARIYAKQKQEIPEFFLKYSKVYLYGAGEFGKMLLYRIRKWGFEPAGFVVTDGHKEMSQEDGLQVYELGELDLKNPEVGIIIAVNIEHQEELERELRINNFDNYMMGYF